MGVAVWPMVELEADDALASAAHLAAADERVEKVCIWTPDKDLAQCVRGDRVVQVDRRAKAIRDAAGVRAKFGVEPALIPDYLALVGDTADGYPGHPGIGKTGAARLLNRHGRSRIFRRGAGREARARAAVQEARDSANRRAAVRRRRGVALARADAPAFRRWSSGWATPRARPQQQSTDDLKIFPDRARASLLLSEHPPQRKRCMDATTINISPWLVALRQHLRLEQISAHDDVLAFCEPFNERLARCTRPRYPAIHSTRGIRVIRDSPRPISPNICRWSA